MAHPDLQIRPAGALGAEIAGIDLTQDVDDGAIAAIRRAWLDHLVIFFRGQELPPINDYHGFRCVMHSVTLAATGGAKHSRIAPVCAKVPNAARIASGRRA
jgi:alpha-ketoglutarate-dependent taurine dioxygenase